MLTSLKSNVWNEKRKIKPAYFSDLEKCPQANLLFMTVDYRCLNYIRNHCGICLFCKKEINLSVYDFSFCYQRTIWILYSSPHDHLRSLQLGRCVQLIGAAETRIMLFNHELLGSD